MDNLAPIAFGEEAAPMPQLPIEKPNEEMEEVAVASTAEKVKLTSNLEMYSPPNKRSRHEKADLSHHTKREPFNALDDQKNFYIHKFYPPTLRPAGKLISVVDMEILAGYLIFYWRSDEFDTYYKLRDSGLYDRAWDMLEYAAEDMITKKLPCLNRARRNEESSGISLLIEVMSQSPLIPSPLSELQDMVTEFRWKNSTLASTTAAADQASSNYLRHDHQNGIEMAKTPEAHVMGSIKLSRVCNKRRHKARRMAQCYTTDSDSDSDTD